MRALITGITGFAGSFLAEMGAELSVCVTTTPSPVLERLPTNEVVIGDLEDFEMAAKAADCDLLITHSHGRQTAELDPAVTGRQELVMAVAGGVAA